MAASEKQNVTSVFNEYSNRLMTFIRKRINNVDDAEDILQDVFFSLLGNTEPIEQVSSWLYKVTRNRITDKYRKKKTESLDEMIEDENLINFDWSNFAIAENGPESKYLRALFWDELNTALSELPEAQREVFIKNELEDIPFNEIAKQTGESVNTLLSRKRYAVLHLRKKLAVLRDEIMNY